MFGTCMWYFLQSAEQTSLVYASTVIFACMSSLVTMVTSQLHQEMIGHNEVGHYLSSDHIFTYQTTSNQILLFERSVNKNRTLCFNRLKECCVVNNLLISSSQNTEVLKRKLKIRNNLHLTSIRTTNFLRESQCACVISRAYFGRRAWLWEEKVDDRSESIPMSI